MEEKEIKEIYKSLVDSNGKVTEEDFIKWYKTLKIEKEVEKVEEEVEEEKSKKRKSPTTEKKTPTKKKSNFSKYLIKKKNLKKQKRSKN
jgi:hypothetical protein